MRHFVVISSNTPPLWQRVEQRLKERHAEISKIQQKRFNTIKKDFDRIYNDEVTFTKNLIKDNFPLEIEVDEEYFNKFPVRIRPKKPLDDLINEEDDSTELAAPLEP